MKLIFLVLFLIALFHLSLYYCNVDLFHKPITNATTNANATTPTTINGSGSKDSEPDGLSETKVELEKYLNELKQYDTNQVHG